MAGTSQSKLPRFFFSSSFAFFFCLAALIFPSFSYATTKPDLVPAEAEIDQNLDQQLDLKLPFSDASGKTAPLSDYLLPGRPTIIVPVYYGCPRLCGFTLKGLLDLINELDFELGKDYKIITVSFDHTEGPDLAAQRQTEQFAKLKFPARGPAGWSFLTGGEPAVQSLMSQLGFHFKKDGDEFSHAAGLMVLTPGGKIARYFFGIKFPSTEMRYSLVEASQGRIGGIIDHVFLYCFRFDPTKGKYSLVVFNVTRIICGLFALALGAMLVALKIKFR